MTSTRGRRARRAKQLARVGATWDSIEVAAARLDTEPQALRARCRRAMRVFDGQAVAVLGMGVVAFKLGSTWRVHVPDPDAAASRVVTEVSDV
jgi:hypothetical protein